MLCQSWAGGMKKPFRLLCLLALERQQLTDNLTIGRAGLHFRGKRSVLGAHASNHDICVIRTACQPSHTGPPAEHHLWHTVQILPQKAPFLDEVPKQLPCTGGCSC